MGNAYVWYYPEGSRVVEAIDLGSRLSDLFERPDVLAYSAEALSGRQTVAIARSRLKIRFVLERFTSSATERALRGAIEHLNRGGHVGIAADCAKAWCGFTRSPVGYGATVLYTNGNPWWNASAALAASDEVYLSSPAPDSQYLLASVSAFADPKVTLSSGVIRNSGPVCVRHRDFYPSLYLPDRERGREQLTSMRRLGWTWDVELVDDADALHTIGSTVGTGRLAGATDTLAAWSVPAVLESAARRMSPGVPLRGVR
jgi:hypothetical protein